MSVPHERRQPRLRIVGEDRAPYDAGDPAPARRRFSMIDQDGSARARKLGPLFYAMYAYLSECANQDGACWPSYNTLATDLGISRRTAINLVKGLEEATLVTIEHRVKVSGHPSSNLITLPHHPHLDGEPHSPWLVQEVHQGSAGGAPSLEQELVNKREREIVPSEKSVSQKRRTPVKSVQQNIQGWEERFVRWYEHYPRKESRADAERAWQKINPDDEQVEQMIVALAWQIPANNWTPANRKFIPHPATYLNRKKWTDEWVAPVAEAVPVPAKVAWRRAQIQRALDIAEGRA